MTIDKTSRENMVLEAIVRMHVKTAIPVGSKHIAEMLGLSSATIRNVMLDLEKEGFLKQPYTSAGRIPTDLGYRRYVDNMHSFEESPIPALDSQIIHYLQKKKLFEEIIEATSHAISQITHYTGIALSPKNKLYFDGTYHMLEQPEFNELSMARDFLKIIEERDDLMNLMSMNLDGEGTVIRIGRENIFDELRECTTITTVYKFKDHISGNIGVIGPMRMKYEKVVPIVESFAEVMNDMLEGI